MHTASKYPIKDIFTYIKDSLYIIEIVVMDSIKI